MRQVLLYQSSAVDITTEPQPEVGLLDMLVFITLSKESFESYWLPKVFGAAGQGINQAFQQSESEVWAMASQVMSPAQQNTVKSLIRQWQNDNPGRYKVEGVRLTSLAQHAGALAEAQAGQAGGLLAGVSSAVERIDEALLMANRGFFLAQRMPFLLRLQARLLTTEILDDLSASGVIAESGGIAQKAGTAALEGKSFVQSIYPLIPNAGMLSQYLGGTERITDKSLALVTALQRSDARRTDPALGQSSHDRLLHSRGRAVGPWVGRPLLVQARFGESPRAGSGQRGGSVVSRQSRVTLHLLTVPEPASQNSSP